MTWRPDDALKREALKKLIRDTIAAAGAAGDGRVSATRLKDALRDYAAGDIDLDACIAEVLAEQKRRG